MLIKFALSWCLTVVVILLYCIYCRGVRLLLQKEKLTLNMTLSGLNMTLSGLNMTLSGLNMTLSGLTVLYYLICHLIVKLIFISIYTKVSIFK